MADEYLKAMIELWTHPVASFHGKYVNFDEMTISVRPVQQPHPPILVVARGERPARRVAQFCQVWLDSPGRDPDAIKGTEERWARILALWKEHGRTGEPYLALGPRPCHLTTRRGRAGEAVVRDAVPGVQPSTTLFPVTHVDELVNQIRTYEAIGADEFAVRPASYRWGEFNSLTTLLNQMELLAEHVLPKFSHS
ncbi:MAG: LLM class flavin-dependent oxidoreductase [Chloroflexota bacterium]